MATFQLTLPAGTSRKHAAHLIAATTGRPAKYMRTPSMAYQIGELTLTRHSELLTSGGISDAVWMALLEAGIKVEQTGFDPDTVHWTVIRVPLRGGVSGKSTTWSRCWPHTAPSSAGPCGWGLTQTSSSPRTRTGRAWRSSCGSTSPPQTPTSTPLPPSRAAWSRKPPQPAP